MTPELGPNRPRIILRIECQLVEHAAPVAGGMHDEILGFDEPSQVRPALRVAEPESFSDFPPREPTRLRRHPPPSLVHVADEEIEQPLRLRREIVEAKPAELRHELRRDLDVPLLDLDKANDMT